jgi:hypothetical protein
MSVLDTLVHSQMSSGSMHIRTSKKFQNSEKNLSLGVDKTRSTCYNTFLQNTTLKEKR